MINLMPLLLMHCSFHPAAGFRNVKYLFPTQPSTWSIEGWHAHDRAVF